MRLFFALRLDESVRNELVKFQDLVRDSILKGHFTLSDNLHLTLVFLGEVEPSRQADLHQILSLLNCQPFSIVIDHPGFFDSREGQIIWLGIKNAPELLTLQAQLSTLLRNFGFRFDARTFTPHISIGRRFRFKKGHSIFDHDFKALSVEITRVSLMVSEQNEERLQYREIDGINL